MNERIKLLAEQCTVSCIDGRGVELNEIDVEKFAELIVRETLDQVAEFSRLIKEYQEQGIDPEIDVAKEVLKNFGVEE
tara:strand:+ start:717 stop:950 length:234 start_codon:yes stop_codon:yes gene_type:complete